VLEVRMRWRITISRGMSMRPSVLLLEAVDVQALGISQRVQVEIDDGRGQIFDRLESLVEVARRLQPLQKAPAGTGLPSCSAWRNG